MPFSRREFLQQTSSVALASGLMKVPLGRRSSLTAGDIIPAPDEAHLRELALKAMDAARAAGATFADIRLTASRYFFAGAGAYRPGGPPGHSAPMVGFPVRYGVRAIVDGAWGFASETVMSADAVVATARTAVAVARANKARHRTHIELAPVPVEAGTWDSPMERDPLDVPLLEMADVALAAVAEAYKVEELRTINISFAWRRPTTVFATTEGTMVLQRFCFAKTGGAIDCFVKTREGQTLYGQGSVDGLRVGQYGYEAVPADTLVENAAHGIRRAMEKAENPNLRPSVEPGRYDIVFGTGAVSALLAGTIGAVLAADYALGYEQDRMGVSFASPPQDMLGRYQIASPLVTVHADRTRPGGAATVGWDTEGVRPEAYTLVDRGIITDYHTDRATAAEIGDWYRSRGQPVRAHGCVRKDGMHVPEIFLPNMTLEPSPSAATEDDLVRDVKRGFYFDEAYGDTDHQGLSGQFYSRFARKITNGKIGELVKDIAFQMFMPQFWKSVDAIGGAPSAKAFPLMTDMSADMDPGASFPFSTFDVVPMRVRKVNVLNIGQTA